MDVDVNPVVAITIKTYLRDGCVQSLVGSIEKFCDLPYRLYIADESPVSESKMDLYNNLLERGHFIHIFDQEDPLSVCAARNFLLANLKDEKFVLRLDDDFLFCEKTSVRTLVSLLKIRPELGAVSGLEIQGTRGKRVHQNSISPGQGIINIDSSGRIMVRRLIDFNSWIWLYASDIRFAYANFTRNFLLIRREAADQVKWNEDLIIDGEHIDFMIRLQEAGWALGFTPESIHYHMDPPRKLVSRLYINARKSSKGHLAMKKVFRQRWGVNELMAVGPSEKFDLQLVVERIKRNVKNLLK